MPMLVPSGLKVCVSMRLLVSIDSPSLVSWPHMWKVSSIDHVLATVANRPT